MTRTISTTLVADIPGIIQDPTRGVVSLVGDCGGLSLITGDVSASGLVMGLLMFETEHGVTYLDPDLETQISEDEGEALPSEDLYAINGMLTALLADRFGWVSDDDADDEQLNELTHAVGSLVQDIIAGVEA